MTTHAPRNPRSRAHDGKSDGKAAARSAAKGSGRQASNGQSRSTKAAAAKPKASPARPGAARPAPARAGSAATAAPAARTATMRAPASRAPSSATAAAPVPASTSRRRRQTAADGGLGKYVYCIIQSSRAREFPVKGIGPQPGKVYTVHYRELAAVVSDTPVVVHDPTRENVLAHQSVNETVMRDFTVIPMSFGTVFKTEEDIVELLRSAHDAFGDVLGKMRDKLEFGLKVIWDREQVIREIESEDEDIRRLRAEIAANKGSTYFARMQYGRLVDAALQARSERYLGEIFSALRDVSVASRNNKPIGDKMIMNAAFLVAREKERAFDARVKEIGGRHAKLQFKYTGPWPPYNFVNIRLKLERAD